MISCHDIKSEIDIFADISKIMVIILSVTVKYFMKYKIVDFLHFLKAIGMKNDKKWANNDFLKYDFQRNIGNFRSFPLSLPIICPVKVQYLMKYKIVHFLHLLKVIGM